MPTAACFLAQVHVPQFPRDMGRKDKAASRGNTLALAVGAHGGASYDAIVKQVHEDGAQHRALEDIVGEPMLHTILVKHRGIAGLQLLYTECAWPRRATTSRAVLDACCF